MKEGDQKVSYPQSYDGTILVQAESGTAKIVGGAEVMNRSGLGEHPVFIEARQGQVFESTLRVLNEDGTILLYTDNS